MENSHDVQTSISKQASMCVDEKEASLVLHAKSDKKSLQVVLGFGPRNPHLAKDQW